MEKYTEMKFEGDLAFLNEHLEQARIISNSSINENDKEGNVVEPERNVHNKNYFENTGNFAYNLTSQPIVNAPSKWNFKNNIVDNNNDSNNINAKNIIDQEEKTEKKHSSKGTNKIQNNVEVYSSVEEQNTTKFNQSEESKSADSHNTDFDGSIINTEKLSLNESSHIASHDEQNSVADFEDLENDDIYETTDDVRYYDTYNNIDEEGNTAQFEQSETRNSVGSQNTDDDNIEVNSHKLRLKESNDLKGTDNQDGFPMSEGIEIDGSYEDTSNDEDVNKQCNIDEEQNTTEFNHSEKSESVDKPNVDYGNNRKNFLETILDDFNDEQIINNEPNQHQIETLERDNSSHNNEFYNNNLHNSTQFDQSEKMENIKNSQNNESFQNSRNFQDPSSGRLNGFENSQNWDHVEQDERLKSASNFQGEKYYNSTDYPNNKAHFNQSEKTANPKEAHNNGGSQNLRNFQNPIQTKISGSENDQYRDTFAPRERLKNEGNFQDARNYKNTDEFDKLNDLNYRAQFAQSKRNGNASQMPNNESFQKPRNFQDARSNAYNDSEGQQNVGNFEQRERLKNDNNFQSQRNFKSSDQFNSSDDLQYRALFEQAERTRNLRNTEHNDSFQNSRDLQDARSIRLNGSESSLNNGNSAPSERLKNDSSFQVGNNFKNIDDFNRIKELQYRNQFEQSEKTGNVRNISNDESFQNLRNFQDPQSNRFNGSESIQNRRDFVHSERMRNDTDFQGTRNYRNTNEFNNIDDLYHKAQFEQSEKAENLRNFHSNENYHNGSGVHHANHNQKTQNVNQTTERDQFYNKNSRNDMQYMQNQNDIENPANSRYMHDENLTKNAGNIRYAAGDYGNSQAEINQGPSDNVSSKNITDINTYPVNEFEVVQPSVIRRKSQLELMLLSSGFDMELFNSFKEELLELEKDNIIMKYKQDLMMTILKS